MKYEEFIQSKLIKSEESGFMASGINPILFDFQQDLVKWACKLGKAAIFANTGLGKTFMQLEWAKQVWQFTKKPVLIIAPLAVSHQTVNEGKKLGLNVQYIEKQSDIINGINITNYEKLDRFDTKQFKGIVLDESSILKSFTGVYRNTLIENFQDTPYKLACSATPAPNDFMELGNHSEFLNKMSRTEMLSMFFYHDGGDTSKWRLKGHAEDKFWQWVASWAAILNSPKDLGYDGSKYALPPLNIEQITVETSSEAVGTLFKMEAKTMDERRAARKDSLEERCQAACDAVTAKPNEIHLVWCGLNTESELLRKMIPEPVEVKGSDSPEYKERMMLGFAEGKIKCLITKAKICGYGMNFQVCHNIHFVGLSDSFEEYYQAVRRCWRFGQTKPVSVKIYTSKEEGAVLRNIQRKEADAGKMLAAMVEYTKKYVQENIKADFEELDKSYKASVNMIIPEWLKSEKQNTESTRKVLSKVR